MKPTNWKKYTGEYEKIFYDIKLKSGKIIENCYPNAGTFHTPAGGIIKQDLVTEIRENETNS